jgi:cardiolipin synthase
MRRFLRILFSRYTISAVFILLYLAALGYFIVYFSIYSLLFFLCAAAVDLIVLIQIINRDINPEVKLTWLAVVMAVPLFGCAIYLILNSRSLHRKESRLMSAIFEKLRSDEKEKERGNAALKDLAAESSSVAGYAHAILRDDALSELYLGEDSEYYPSGEKFYQALLSRLQEAKRYIFIETFIICEGKMWDGIHEILKKKAAEGIDVRLLYDDLGSMRGVGAHFDRELCREGIKCHRFGRITPRLVATHNNRDHRKIVVIDGEVAFTGGINLADEYINAKTRFGHWKDGGICIFGSAVLGFVRLFLSLWCYTERSTDVPLEYLSQGCPQEKKRDGFMIPYGSGPAPIYPVPVCKNMLMGIINGAQSYVFITTPYLIIDYDLTEALRSAAARGVDVRIITPGIPDKRMVNVMTKSAYPRLIEAGVRIFEYTPGFIHEKSIVADGEVAAVGTVNFDYRSLIHHYECGVWLARCSVISDVRDGFLQTLEHSIEITPEAARLGLGKKIAKNLVRIFAPLM